jgi:hypothetical protein
MSTATRGGRDVTDAIGSLTEVSRNLGLCAPLEGT